MEIVCGNWRDPLNVLLNIGLRLGGMGILRVESLGLGADVEKILSQRKASVKNERLTPDI